MKSTTPSRIIPPSSFIGEIGLLMMRYFRFASLINLKVPVPFSLLFLGRYYQKLANRNHQFLCNNNFSIRKCQVNYFEHQLNFINKCIVISIGIFHFLFYIRSQFQRVSIKALLISSNLIWMISESITPCEIK